MSGNRIVIFAKAPVPGRVKTRLIPALGAKRAAELAQEMLQATWREASQVAVARAEICASPAPAEGAWRGLLPPGADLLTHQGEGDLGERLARAAERVIGGGERVLLIGTDCPALDAGRLKAACSELEPHDAVIHPTFDGGYALLGLRRFDPSIFAGIAWSTSTVARETMQRIDRLGWRLHLGKTLHDVDEPEDLVHLPPQSRFRPGVGAANLSL